MDPSRPFTSWPSGSRVTVTSALWPGASRAASAASVSPAAEAEALELLLLADIQASADRLSDIVDDRIGLLRRQSSAAWCGWPQIYRHGQRDDARRDVEELDAESDRLARWYGALIAVAGACADVLADRVPA